MKTPQICEYCRLIHRTLTYARTPRARRHALARFKLHKRVLHSNPPSARRIRLAKVAAKLAYKLYKQFKGVGVPKFVMDRVPAEIRPYVMATLDFNGIKVS